MNVFFLERRTAPSGTFTRTGPRSGSARRGSATLLVKKMGQPFVFVAVLLSLQNNEDTIGACKARRERLHFITGRCLLPRASLFRLPVW